MKILTSKCCDELIKLVNTPDVIKLYSQPSFDSSRLEFLKSELNVEDPSSLQLDPSENDDCNNSISIFEHFKKLDRVQANDRRFWVTLTHTHFFEYTKKRWNINKDTSDKTLIRRFHFEGSSLETRMRNSLSRLWWSAKITYDESREDKYELTKLLWSKQDIYMGLVERSFGTYSSVVKGFLEFYSNNLFLKEGQIRSLLTGLNAIGGVKPLALHSKDEIIDILIGLKQFLHIENKSSVIKSTGALAI
jgi:hypothetical protein